MARLREIRELGTVLGPDLQVTQMRTFAVSGRHPVKAEVRKYKLCPIPNLARLKQLAYFFRPPSTTFF
eukprot:m.125358 g.125358  ORF g.125358 m.125358 type:complete len:68 (+) comp15737_c1_seq20:558-761(+)